MHGLRDTVGAADYPKGTGSGSRSYLAGRRWRPAARHPAAITTPPVGLKYPSILPVGAIHESPATPATMPATPG